VPLNLSDLKSGDLLLCIRDEVHYDNLPDDFYAKLGKIYIVENTKSMYRGTVILMLDGGPMPCGLEHFIKLDLATDFDKLMYNVK
jgi:hypothetical protein